MGTALQFLLEAFQALPGLIAKGIDVSDYISRYTEKVKSFGSNDPTTTDWDALHAEIAADRHRLHSDID